jgi:serine/threonine-protein kinase RsbW
MTAESSDPGQWFDLLDLSVPADAKAIAQATDTISETLTSFKVPEEKRLQIALAVQEALANAVVHGCKNDPSKEVRCRLKRNSQGGVLVTITDPGPGFSPLQLTDPQQPGRLYADHGRGVSLIRQLMDEVYFEHGGNQITMRKY